jgi:lipopolysaccharide transport system ATP-binding protein
MPDIAIRIENLGKRYRYGGAAPLNYNLRADIMDWAKGLWRRDRQRHASLSEVRAKHITESPDYFWAIRDINLEIQHGEVVGIIGRNGAGKSTLLKVLSRITPPTAGKITYFGRMASLLEVGTGFHRELTGRENIYLNGSILGMRRAEITQKLDEIIAFAEIDKFIDTPVKFYSSGMYVRLAFAVAAHLDPEILLVDEVLAVGDAEFQKKCLGKMSNVAREGRTVLFVSHNMAAIHSLCRRALWINSGQIEADGKPDAIINAYLERLSKQEDSSAVLRSVDGNLEILKVLTTDAAGNVANSFRPGDPLVVEVHYSARQPVRQPYLWISVNSQWGDLFCAHSLLTGDRPDTLEGKGCFCLRFDQIPLIPQQTYSIKLGGRTNDGESALLRTAEVTSFRVVGTAQEAGLMGRSAESVVANSIPVILPHQWEYPDGTVARWSGFTRHQP